MNALADFLVRTYGEEDIEKDMDLRKELFWSGIRSSLYKKVHKEKDSHYQWAYITGKTNRRPDGSRITLSDRNVIHFENIIEYLNSEEGLDNMHDYGVYDDPPQHPDDLICIIDGAMTDRQIKKEIFRLFMKHRNKILDFLEG